jgi:hypothetical protein
MCGAVVGDRRPGGTDGPLATEWEGRESAEPFKPHLFGFSFLEFLMDQHILKKH